MNGYINVLQKESAKATYGTLWLNINSEKGIALAKSFLFFLRRYLIAILIVYFPDDFLQLAILWAFSLLMLLFYITVKPMNDPAHNCIETINEVIVYVSSCFMYLFTGFVKDAFSRLIFGYVFIGLAYLCIVLNLAVIVRVTVQWLKLYFRI